MFNRQSALSVSPFVEIIELIFDTRKTGAMYGNFAGRDASRGLAKNSFDEDMLTDPNAEIDKLEDLDQEEWQSLRDWAGFFEGK